MRYSTAQLQFLARFSRTPEGRALLELKRSELADLDTEVRNAGPETVALLQGRARQVADDIERMVDAEKKLNLAAKMPQAFPRGGPN